MRPRRVARRVHDAHAVVVQAAGQVGLLGRRHRPVGAAPVGGALEDHVGTGLGAGDRQREGAVLGDEVGRIGAGVLEALQPQRAHARVHGVDLEGRVVIRAHHAQHGVVAGQVEDLGAVQAQRGRRDGDAVGVVAADGDGPGEGQRVRSVAAEVGRLHRLPTDQQVELRCAGHVDDAVELDAGVDDVGPRPGVDVVTRLAVGARQPGRGHRRRLLVDVHRDGVRVAGVASLVADHGAEAIDAVGQIGLGGSGARPVAAAVGRKLEVEVAAVGVDRVPPLVADQAQVEGVGIADEVVVERARVLVVGQAQLAAGRRRGVDAVVDVGGHRAVREVGDVADGVLQGGGAGEQELVGLDLDAVEVVDTGLHGVQELQFLGAAAAVVDGLDRLVAHAQAQGERAFAAGVVHHGLAEHHGRGDGVARVEPAQVGSAGRIGQADGLDDRRLAVDLDRQHIAPVEVLGRIDHAGAELVLAVGQAGLRGRGRRPARTTVDRALVFHRRASFFAGQRQREGVVARDEIAGVGAGVLEGAGGKVERAHPRQRGVDLVVDVGGHGLDRQRRQVAGGIADGAAVHAQVGAGDGDTVGVVQALDDGEAEAQLQCAAAAGVDRLDDLAAHIQVEQRRTGDVDGAVELDDHGDGVVLVQPTVLGATGGRSQPGAADHGRRAVDGDLDLLGEGRVARVVGDDGAEAVSAVDQAALRRRRRVPVGAVGRHLVVDGRVQLLAGQAEVEVLVGADVVGGRDAEIVEVHQAQGARLRRGGVDPVGEVGRDGRVGQDRRVADDVGQRRAVAEHQAVGGDLDAVVVVTDVGGDGVDEGQRIGLVAAGVDGVDRLAAHLEFQRQRADARGVKHRLGELDRGGDGVTGVQQARQRAAGEAGQRDRLDLRVLPVDGDGDLVAEVLVAGDVDDTRAEAVVAIVQT